MALLGTIRNQFGWVMMALVFIGVASFLFMDISPGANTASGRSATVGYVNGEKVSNDLIQKYSSEYKGAGYLQEEIQSQVWDRVVGEKLLTQKTEAAGMLITPTELGQLFLSDDPRLLSPVVRQQLAEQSTGQVNTQRIAQMIDLYKNTNNLLRQAGDNPQQKQQLLEQQEEWLALEKSVKTRALQDKYFIALEKGIYTPSWMVELENKIQETGYNIDYVRVPYTSIKDKVEVSDQEMKDYIAAHPRQYKREATANIEYVLFDVIPTSEDSTYYYNSMEERAQELRDAKTTKEDSSVVLQYTREFATNFYTKTEMPAPANLIDSIFDADEKTVFGPYVEGQKYKVLKKVEEKILPDSVKARHILIKAQDPTAGQKARVLLDSIKNLLETDPNASFDSLALQFSDDGSKTKGGDLGWQGKDVSFVPQFKEYMFYTGEKDSLQLLYTQFGVHLIQITDTKYETDRVGIRIAVLEEPIIPTSKTTEAKKREAVEFIANNRTLEDMKKAAKEKGMTVAPASGLEKGAYEILGLGKNSTAAGIITWAHLPETKVNDVTGSAYAIDNDDLGYTEKFVVMALANKVEKGLATIADPQVRADVETILRNEKKTAIVKGKLGTLTSLDAIAGEYGVIKQSATNVQYGSATVGVEGTEPKVAGLAANTEVGQMSGAVGGKTGVYVVKVTSRNEAPAIANVKTAREKVTRRVSQAISSGVYENIKENAEIIDERVN